jgi:hypothetical protein
MVRKTLKNCTGSSKILDRIDRLECRESVALEMNGKRSTRIRKLKRYVRKKRKPTPSAFISRSLRGYEIIRRKIVFEPSVYNTSDSVWQRYRSMSILFERNILFFAIRVRTFVLLTVIFTQRQRCAENAKIEWQKKNELLIKHTQKHLAECWTINHDEWNTMRQKSLVARTICYPFVNRFRCGDRVTHPVASPGNFPRAGQKEANIY